MVVVSFGGAAVVFAVILAKLRGGELPERILARMKMRPNEWREYLVLRIGPDDDLLVCTSRRKIRTFRLDTSEVWSANLAAGFGALS